MEIFEKNIESGKRNNRRKKSDHCQFFNQEHPTECLWIELKHSRREAGNKQPQA